MIAHSHGLAGWQTIQEALAQRLNFYRNFNGRIAVDWAISERRKFQKLESIAT